MIAVTEHNGVGLKVTEQGTANVMNAMIMANGGTGGKTGVEVDTSERDGVTLSGVVVSNFTTGISVTSGEVTVMGGSIVQVEANGTGVGLKVERDGKATVMNSAIMATRGGGTGKIGVESSGTVTLTGVKIEKFEKGVSVTKGTVTVNGDSTIKGTTMGVEVKGGTFMMGGEESGIVVEADGTGLKVEGSGSATVMNTTITTSGGAGVTGVEVNTSGGKGVTLDGVTVTEFKTGISVTKGTFKMTRGSITGNGSGSVGVYAASGTLTLEGGVKISKVTTGVYVESGESLTIRGGTEIELASWGRYGVYVGALVTKADLKDVKITGIGKVGSYGVYAASGGTLTDVTIERFEKGVYMTSGTLTMTRGSITGTGGTGSYGVQVANGGTLTDVMISSFATGVSVTGGELTVKGGSITGTGETGSYGVYAVGGDVTLDGGVEISKVEMGVYMTGDGTLEVKKGTEINLARGGDYGVYVGREVTKATLEGVTIKGDRGNGGSGTGIHARGGNMMISGGEISQVKTGVYMKSGTLTISGSSRISVVGDDGVGVIVGDGVKSANLKDVKITGENRRNGGSGTGIHARGKLVMISGGTRIEGVKEGIVMMGDGELTVKDRTTISLASEGKYGVYVGREVTRATLTETVITGQKSGTGVYAVGKMVTISGGEIKEVKTGVMMMSGESLTISGNSTISFVSDYGVGVKVGDGVKSANLKDVKITGNGSGGMGVHAMGEMMMISGGEISEVKTGVYTEKGTLMMTGGTKINLARSGTGVYVKNTAMTKLTGTVITGQNKGTGVYAVGMMGKGEMMVALTDVKISDVDKGVEVKSGKSLTISGNSTISVVGSGTGVRAIGGDVTLDGVEITGGGLASTGVEVWGGKEVTLTNVGISNVGKGVTMKNGGMLTISGESSVISFVGDGVGVKVEGDVTKADLNDVTIRGNGSGGMGVYAEGTGTNGALTMTLDKVRIEGVGMGVYAGGGTLTVNKGTTISFVGDGDYGVGVGVGALVTSASLDNVTITGNGSGGIGVHAMEGEVMMTDVKISQVGAGVSVEGSGSLTVERGEIKEFMDYGVYVGGKVTRADLMGTVITGQNRGNGVGGTGVVMESSGKMMLEDVGISNVGKGVTMKNGGMLTISGERSVISFVGEYGVYAGGDVKNVRLDGVTITGNGSGGMGVHAMGTTGKNGAFRMELTNVKISEVGAGVVMGKGKSLTISGGSIAKVKTGVIMMSGESMTVERGTTIEFTGKYGYGVMVGIDVTRATLNDVTIRGNGSGGMGVYAEGTGTNGALTMTLDKVRISEVGAGVVMEGDGTLTVNKGTTIELASDGKYGVYVKGDVSASLMGTVITGMGSGTGVHAEGGETVALDEVTIKEVETGVKMRGGKSLTVMGESTINFMGGYGVKVGYVETVELTKTKIVGQKSGRGGNDGVNMGIYAEGIGEMTLNDVTIEEVKTGVSMKNGGMLVISGDSTINFTGDYGVYVKNTAMVELTKTKIIGQNSGRGGNNGVKYGVYATGGDVTMTLNDVRIEEVKTGITMLGGGLKVSGGSITKVETGIAMSGSGTLMVEKGTEIQFTKGYGVMVGERVTANLMGTTIKGEGKGSTGVYVAGGKALLEQVKIEGSNQATGLYVTQGAVRLKNTTLRDVAMGMTISQGVVMMEGGSIEFTDRYGISVSGGQAVLSGFKIIKKGNKDTDKSTGVWVGNSGKVMMREVDISGVQMGAYVMETGLLVMDKGSIDFKGEYGIYTSLQNSTLSYSLT